MVDEFGVIWIRPKLEILAADGSLARYTVTTRIKPLVPISVRWIPYAADGRVYLLRHDPGKITEVTKELGVNRARVIFDPPLLPGTEVEWTIEVLYQNSFTKPEEFFEILLEHAVAEIHFELSFPQENVPTSVKAVFFEADGDEKLDNIQPEFDKSDPRKVIWHKEGPQRGLEYRIVWTWQPPHKEPDSEPAEQ